MRTCRGEDLIFVLHPLDIGLASPSMSRFCEVFVQQSGGLRPTGRSDTAFRIAELRIDPKSCDVTGPGGRERLDPRVMDVLTMLAQDAGQVVLREDLLEQLWPRAVVTDEVLSRCIYVLRTQLSRAGGSDRYRKMIETVPKRGYRLNAVVRPDSPAPTGPAVHRRLPAIGGAFGIAVFLVLISLQYFDRPPATTTGSDPAPSIAVLPFADLSARQDKQHYADGLAEEILNRLAQAQELRVISRTSSFSFSGRPPDIREIAARLEVSHVLEGSLRWSGNSVRVTAQLIDAASDSRLWSATYDRTVEDLFSVQDVIAAEVAAALHVSFADDPQRPRATVNAAALERYLQGQYFYNRGADGDLARATEYFEEAVAIDPSYASAWAALSGSYSILGLRTQQGDAARRATMSDPGLAAAHARLAMFYFDTGDLDNAEASLRTAAELDPNDPLVLVDQIEKAVDRGDIETAIRLQRRVVAQDPLSPGRRNNLAVYLIAAGHLDKALIEYRKAKEIHPDAVTESGIELDMEIARVLVLQGRFDEAQTLLEGIPPGNYRDHISALLLAASPDSRAAADSALLQLAASTESIPDYVRLAETFAYRGEIDEAMSTLEARLVALNNDAENAFYASWHLRHESRLSPFLRPLHADPRWARFMGQGG